jgi:ribosomal protein L14
MIKIGTLLRIVDNSGAKWGKCVFIKQKGKYPSGCVGAMILVTLKKFSHRKKVVKRTIYKGLVVGVSH